MRRGPSESELARAWLAEQARLAAGVLVDYDDDKIVDLIEEMEQLPARELSLQLPLPRLLSPKLERLRQAMVDEDVEEVVLAVPAALARVDTPLARAGLARAVLAAREEGRIDGGLAAAAMIELASSSVRLVRNSLIQALAVAGGQLGPLPASSSPPAGARSRPGRDGRWPPPAPNHHQEAAGSVICDDTRVVLGAQ